MVVASRLGQELELELTAASGRGSTRCPKDRRVVETEWSPDRTVKKAATQGVGNPSTAMRHQNYPPLRSTPFFARRSELPRALRPPVEATSAFTSRIEHRRRAVHDALVAATAMGAES
jgi:hypothetical protein